MKLKDIIKDVRMYVVAGLSLFAMEQAMAGNVSGTVRSIPSLTPLRADIIAVKKGTNERC